MDRLGGGASFPEDLGLRNLETLEDLGDSLRRLRRRYARRRSDALLSYRYLAEKTGYAHGVIGGYFSGKVLPPPDKLDVIVVLLGADSSERLAFAAARDAIEERRRRPSESAPGSAAGAGGANGHGGSHSPGAGRSPTPAAAASSYLYDLLTRPGRYRTQWRSLLVPGKGAVDAIAEVIARSLADRGAEDADQDLVKLRGRVSRALAGNSPDTVLSSATLNWFADAFDIAPDDADRLRFLHAGSSSIRYVRGDAQETDLPIFDAPPARHRTVDLREYHYLGPDGLPVQHRTDQVLEATEDGLDRYTYMVDTNMLTLDVQTGGVPGLPYQLRARDGNVYHAIDILLERPLPRGATAVLNYTATFRYEEAPPTEMRRVFRRKVDNYLLWIHFHPDMVPSKLWWAEWNGVVNSSITHREPMTLNSSNEAHRFLEGGVAQAVVGFYWEW
ncbi:MAG TPA: helix-turn-helix transcriptional regulator [Actinocrinis sp.]|uniref:helix-turn-helix domain-containing protein n=1 Tax=Actinocrinis sp. TaxID=1920516 RepID=UPI002D60AC9F|nr:helix-turn-helix transcriptional regulator [Actinocrinis sp.]HZU54519.1 helix-turn-helix transcriptional regulator [Actinocrinis sp.]